MNNIEEIFSFFKENNIEVIESTKIEKTGTALSLNDFLSLCKKHNLMVIYQKSLRPTSSYEKFSLLMRGNFFPYFEELGIETDILESLSFKDFKEKNRAFVEEIENTDVNFYTFITQYANMQFCLSVDDLTIGGEKINNIEDKVVELIKKDKDYYIELQAKNEKLIVEKYESLKSEVVDDMAEKLDYYANRNHRSEYASKFELNFNSSIMARLSFRQYFGYNTTLKFITACYQEAKENADL